jgi:lipopolysaccharide/colanic/teichoic acid biosynthesis glycosyltransferase
MVAERISSTWDDRAPAGFLTISPATTPVAYRIAKRAIDLVGASLCLLMLLPLMLLTALLVKLESAGPVFFWQTRVGTGGRRFRFYKFRSMCTEAVELQAALEGMNEVSGPVFKIRQDPRITHLGRLLRKMSVDELPQLWHVATGQMSLVGPRPPIPEEVERYEPWMLERLAVKPGLTCIWQVSGRSDIPFDEWMRMDVEYVRRRSLGLDLRILAQTIPAVLTGRGAY